MIQSMPFPTVRGVTRIICPFLSLLFLVLPVAHAGDWTGNVSGYVGRKFMDDSDWPNLDQQLVIGVLFDIRKREWPVSIAVDILGSGDGNESGSRKLKGYTLEEYIGVRKIFELQNPSIRPYVGGGACLDICQAGR